MRIVPQAVVVLGQLLVLGACCGSVHGLPAEGACPYTHGEIAWDDPAAIGVAPGDRSAPYLGEWVIPGTWAADGAPTELAIQVDRDEDATPIFFDGHGECPDFVQIPMTMEVVASDGGLSVWGAVAWNAYDGESLSLITDVEVGDEAGSFDPATELRRGETAEAWSVRVEIADDSTVTGGVRLDIDGDPNRFVDVLVF